ncbi:hypothetical protein C8J57DRAFT_1510164 [Mycena rebaudengoi]|nr:hypothetical protein C8J57DRAFT_1541619 [Mycena rebaudengoi]KAJ7268070.1 hypothetical protein C8J57DRAFT_1510164 [Mycena rebaudengoi]
MAHLLPLVFVLLTAFPTFGVAAPVNAALAAGFATTTTFVALKTGTVILSQRTLLPRDGSTMSPSVIIKLAVMTTLFVFAHVALLLVWCKCRKRRTPQPSTHHPPDARLSLSLCLTPTRMSGETVVAHPFTAHVMTDDDGSKDIADEAVEMALVPAPVGRSM